MVWKNTEQGTQRERQSSEITEKEKLHTVFPFEIQEKISEKPLRVKGVALTAGISRNLNIYTPEELQVFANKLVGAPMYIEHVAVPCAVGRVTKTSWDGHTLHYEAEVYDEETAEKIRKGLIQHVSVGADYETVDFLSGKIPHGLHNAEISLVAVPGVPDANVQVMEKLHVQSAGEPLIMGEYVLGFYQDASTFLSEHFTTVWLDKEGGVLAVLGKMRQHPEAQRTMAVFFSKQKTWDKQKIQEWLSLHPEYLTVAVDQNITLEGLLKKSAEPRIRVSEAVALIEAVLPSPIVQRSWSLGPQRMCQELRRVILKLQCMDSHDVLTGSS